MIFFERRRCTVCNFDAGRSTLENAIASERWIRFGADEDARLCVTINVVVLKQAATLVKDANAAVAPIVDFISPCKVEIV